MLSRIVLAFAILVSLCFIQVARAFPTGDGSQLIDEEPIEYYDVPSDLDSWDDDDTADNSTELEKRYGGGVSGTKLVQKNVPMTYYWLALQNEYSTSGKKVWLGTCDKKKIVEVSEDFAVNIRMEGSGIAGGKVLNLDDCDCGSGFNCFFVLDKKEFPYGQTAYGDALRPYVTIASNDLKRGLLFIPKVNGWRMPGSKHKHNGCFYMDDQSWSFGGHHIDFFSYSEAAYTYLDNKHDSPNVDIYYVKKCPLIKYLT